MSNEPVQFSLLREISSVVNIGASREDVLNAHLKKGWVIIGREWFKREWEETTIFTLGWPSSKGEVCNVTLDDYDIDYSAPDGWNS